MLIEATAKGALAHPFRHKMTSVAIGPGKQLGICSHLAGEALPVSILEKNTEVLPVFIMPVSIPRKEYGGIASF